MPFSMTGAPASTFTPPGRKLSKARCAVMASAFRPTMSLGRPGRCTSPAEIMVVTPPFMVESIQPSWLWRGVQSPNTGCTWLSIRPGATQVFLQSMTVFAPSRSQSFSLPTATISPSFTTMVSASRIGRSMSPDSSRPMFRMTTLPDLAPAATSAMSFPRGSGCLLRARPASTVRSTVSITKSSQCATASGRLERLAEEGGQRVPVRRVEVAGRGDQQVQVARRHVVAEQALRDAAGERSR